MKLSQKQGRVTFNVFNCTQIYTHSPFNISIHLDVFFKTFFIDLSLIISLFHWNPEGFRCHQANVPINLKYWDFTHPDFLGVEIEQRYPVPDLGSQPPGGSGSLPELMIQFRQAWQTGKRSVHGISWMWHQMLPSENRKSGYTYGWPVAVVVVVVVVAVAVAVGVGVVVNVVVVNVVVVVVVVAVAAGGGGGGIVCLIVADPSSWSLRRKRTVTFYFFNKCIWNGWCIFMFFKHFFVDCFSQCFVLLYKLYTSITSVV